MTSRATVDRDECAVSRAGHRGREARGGCAARRHGLGFTDRYHYALRKQGKYQASLFHGYLAKLARYLAETGSAAEFLQKHHGLRVFYVAPWLSQLSGLTMTITRIRRHVWAARQGFCDMPKSS